MKDYKYLITEKQLNEIVKFAQHNPYTQFSSEPMNDYADFLSCTFITPDGNCNASGFWELSGV